MVKISKKYHKTKQGVIKKNPKKRNTFNLPMQIAILVPSTKNVDDKISNSEFKKRISLVKKYLAAKFGGFTSVQSVGGFLSDSKKLVEEDAVMVISYATRKDFAKYKTIVMDWVRDRGSDWGQESMGIIIENDLKYIKWSKK